MDGASLRTASRCVHAPCRQINLIRRKTMTIDKATHNHNSDLPEPIASQAAIHESDEAALRAAVEEVFGDLGEEVTFPELKSRCVMALLSVKYEDRQIGESQPNFINRRNEIMATSIKKKLSAELDNKKAERAAAPAKAPKAEKAPKAPKEGAAAPAPRGRAAAVNKVRANPEGGNSKLNASSERSQVFELIKKAGAKGITIDALDEAFAEVCKANEVEPKKTRGFVLKLLEKNWVLVLG